MKNNDKILNDKIQEVLKKNNPFLSGSAGDPREYRYPDAAGLNDDILEALKNIIIQKSESHQPLCATVIGETGTGKTHLCGRLIEESKKSQPFSFAYILPLTDPNQEFRYLLREIVVNLNKPIDNGLSQFEIVAGKIFSRVIRKIAKEKNEHALLSIAEQIEKNPQAFLSMNLKPKTQKGLFKQAKSMLQYENIEISPDFINIFLQYCLYKEKRLAAIKWLMGNSVDVEDIKELGVKDRSEYSTAALEQEAKDILKSLDIILYKYGHLLVVTFDQLENLGNIDLIKSVSNHIFFLSDTAKAMLPIVFLRGALWKNRFKIELDDYVRARLLQNFYELKGCSPEQAKELIRVRLAMAFKGKDFKLPHELYPFYPGYANEFEKKILSYDEINTRRVIIEAGNLLHEILYHNLPPERSVDEILKEKLETHYKKILDDFNHYSPDEGRLTKALELYLSSRPADNAFQVSDITLCSDKIRYIDIEASISKKDKSSFKAAFLIDVELHHKAVGASLNKGFQYLEKDSSGKAVYIRDPRCPLPEPPKWQSTNEVLTKFENLGGKKIHLTDEEAALWYALVHLKFDVGAGDISKSSGEPVQSDELEGFISRRINGANYPAFKALEDYLSLDSKPIIEEILPPTEEILPPIEEILRQSEEILNETVGKMMKAELLCEKLNMTTQIKLKELIAILEKNKKKFNIIGRGKSIIQLVKMEKYND